MAIKAAGGVDLPVSDFINGAKSYLAEELVDHVLDRGAIEQALTGSAAKEAMELVGEGYQILKSFMEKHKDKGKNEGYVRFDKLMQKVDDGQGGKIWVSKRNARKWNAKR